MTSAIQLQGEAAAFGCKLSIEGAELLLAYLDAMLEENRAINLTAVRDREAAVMFHALDSLVMGSENFDLMTGNCLDIGTGNGFPGVAIACLFPEAKVLLMDRTLKKLKAIERALQVAGFDSNQFETIQMDAAEALGHGYRSNFDLITTRAVGPPEEMGRLAGPLLRPAGRLLCWLSDGAPVQETLPGGLERRSEVEYTLPAPAERQRRLVSWGR